MNISKTRKIWFGFSGLLIIASILLMIFYPLKPAIDFTGGSLLELKFTGEKILSKEEIAEIVAVSGLEKSVVTPTGQGRALIRTKPVDQAKKDSIISEITNKIGDNGGVEEVRFETIGPTVSSDLLKKAIISVVLASLGIIFYIAYAFRKMSESSLSWIFGVTAVVALIHDVIIATGAYAFMSSLFGWEVDSLLITALLTVMGFSVHDTIVVFDRLRENIINNPSLSLETNVNNSIMQTIARSINTSLTILIPLAALIIIGGTTLQPFVSVLFIGILVGTYSSIFIAAPIVTIWQNWRMRTK